VVGASLEEPEEEDDARSTTSSIIAAPKEGCYEVVGTVKDREAPKPDFMKEVIKVTEIIYIQCELRICHMQHFQYFLQFQFSS
jgi:hypothetical protein